MSRISRFLSIALGVAAIGSATVPAEAGALQVFGGMSHLAQLPAAAPAPAKTQVIQSPHTIPTAPGISSMSPGKVMIPLPKSKDQTSMTNGEFPAGELPPAPSYCSTHPLVPFCHPHPPCPPDQCNPPPPPLPIPHRPEGGPIVIVAPPIQVPVAVPVAPPYGAQRIGGGSASAATARPQPVITPQCMTTADNPPLASMIDQLLPTAPLSDAARAEVTELRQTIQVLATDGKAAAARDTEEIAMNLLGYQKVWLQCGTGVFTWQKQVASADAGQQK